MAQRAWAVQDDEEPGADAAVRPVVADIQDDDPVNAALDAAPYDDEPLTAEDRAAMETGRQEYLRGEYSPLEEVFDRLLGERSADDSSTG